MLFPSFPWDVFLLMAYNWSMVRLIKGTNKTVEGMRPFGTWLLKLGITGCEMFRVYLSRFHRVLCFFWTCYHHPWECSPVVLRRQVSSHCEPQKDLSLLNSEIQHRSLSYCVSKTAWTFGQGVMSFSQVIISLFYTQKQKHIKTECIRDMITIEIYGWVKEDLEPGNQKPTNLEIIFRNPRLYSRRVHSNDWRATDVSWWRGIYHSVPNDWRKMPVYYDCRVLEAHVWTWA